MPGVSVSIGTIYACNFEFLNNFSKKRSLSRCFKNFRDCRHIWSTFEPRLQAYMVPIVTQIAVILWLIYGPHLDWDCGPYYNQNCKHNQPTTPPLYNMLIFIWNQAASQIRWILICISYAAYVNFRRLPSFDFNADEELFCRQSLHLKYLNISFSPPATSNFSQLPLQFDLWTLKLIRMMLFETVHFL